MNLVTLLKEQVVLAQELRVGCCGASLSNKLAGDRLLGKQRSLKDENKLLLRELVIS